MSFGKQHQFACGVTASFAGLSRSLRYQRLARMVIVSFHVVLLAWGAAIHSPTWDEIAHLPAGISHWLFGRFDLYCVNPPLVRAIAAVPVLLSEPAYDWSRYYPYASGRVEFLVGQDFLRANGESVFWRFTIARWACLPFSILGAYVCFRWAKELYGETSGLFALCLWCFSPNILAHAQLITPDAAAAALGAGAGFCFWRWLGSSTWITAFIAGAALGFAELAKTTWIFLFLLWPLLWVIWDASHRQSLRDWIRQLWQLLAILALAVLVVNCGYFFQGTSSALGAYEFSSKALTGRELPSGMTGNRFAGSLIGLFPVPFPEDYVLGIDLQKRGFEDVSWSYLGGDWRTDGWWYYYFYALALKAPLGTWIIVAFASFVTIHQVRYRTLWRNEMLLLAPAMALIVLVSFQIGINRHLRYVLPAFPFIFVWASKSVQRLNCRSLYIKSVVFGAFIWSIASSLWVYPHSLSYFNELAGGPTRGHHYLLGSNIDWGQDLLLIRRWLDSHPNARPIALAYSVTIVDPRIAGIDATVPPPGPGARLDAMADAYSASRGPLPGWYAISVNKIHSVNLEFTYFSFFEPTARIGYTTYIFYISVDEANSVRRRLGLPIVQPAPEREDQINGGLEL